MSPCSGDVVDCCAARLLSRRPPFHVAFVEISVNLQQIKHRIHFNINLCRRKERSAIKKAICSVEAARMPGMQGKGFASAYENNNPSNFML